MNISNFRKQFPAYDDIPDDELAGMLHSAHFPDTPREQFDAEFLGGIDYTSRQEPFSETRLKFEIGLAKNPKTSKSAVMLPDTANMTSVEVVKLAKSNRMKALRQNGSFYLFNPAKISETTLRRHINNGTEGQDLGYGTDNVPATGVDYAVNLDGHGTMDVPTIKQWRDSDQLGFAGRANDAGMAESKVREMGRDDAEMIAGTLSPEGNELGHIPDEEMTAPDNQTLIAEIVEKLSSMSPEELQTINSLLSNEPTESD